MEQSNIPEGVITEEVAEKGDIGGMKLKGRLTCCVYKSSI